MLPFREGRDLLWLWSQIWPLKDVHQKASQTTGTFIGSDTSVLEKHKQLVREVRSFKRYFFCLSLAT